MKWFFKPNKMFKFPLGSLSRDLMIAYFGSRYSHNLIRKISLLSGLAMILSLAAFILVLSVMNDLNFRVKSRLLKNEPHLSIVLPTSVSNEQEEELRRFFADSEDCETVLQVNRREVLAFSWPGNFQLAELWTIPPDSWDIVKQKMGVLGAVGEEVKSKVLIGRDLAHALGVLPSDSLRLIAVERLVGASEQLAQMVSLEVEDWFLFHSPEWDRSVILSMGDSPESVSPSLSDSKKTIFVFLRDPFHVVSLKRQLSEKWSNLKITTWQDRNHSTLFALRLEKALIAIFLSLACLIALFSIFLALALFMAQKFRDFILLRLLGLSYAKTRDLSHHMTFFIASLLLVVGVSLGVLVSLYLEHNPIEALPEIYYDTAISAQVDLSGVAILVLVGWALIYFLTRRLLSFVPAQDLAHHLKQNQGGAG